MSLKIRIKSVEKIEGSLFKKNPEEKLTPQNQLASNSG